MSIFTKARKRLAALTALVMCLSFVAGAYGDPVGVHWVVTEGHFDPVFGEFVMRPNGDSIAHTYNASYQTTGIYGGETHDTATTLFAAGIYYYHENWVGDKSDFQDGTPNETWVVDYRHRAHGYSIHSTFSTYFTCSGQLPHVSVRNPS